MNINGEQTTIDVIIPAFNEQDSIQLVLKDIPSDLVREVVVVNNNSTDETSKLAKEAGATVLSENKKGYGHACLKGIQYLISKEKKPDIIVFLDADYSDHPEEMPRVVAPILQNNYDFVIGSRSLGNREKGSMTPQQVFGNWLATSLMRLLYGTNFTDLGPFRAIKFDSLTEIGMQDKTYGWTIEMQLKAAKKGLRYCEVPVSYRRRIGVSKVSGTVKGTIMAGIKIIYAIFKYL
jgi:glycosyltransferase involved in cell wall biosynthesis